MPHLDMDGSSDMTDYSDFEYQVIHAQINLKEDSDSTGNTNPAAEAFFDFDPLDGSGGLQQNEVAELVYLETYAFLEHEDATADQDVATSSEFRGMIGINLSNSDADLVDINNQAADIQGQVRSTNNISDSNVLAEATERTDDRFLQPFKVAGSPPFDDQTNGPGGNNFTTEWTSEKQYRDLTGRGPVLDSTDNISLTTRATAEDIVIRFRGDIKMLLIWDVAEVSDAGRAFSVPQSMR